jgi:hypothetical protein
MQKPSTHLLRSFRAKARHRKTAFKRFLTRLEKKPIRGLQQLIAKEEKRSGRRLIVCRAPIVARP